jgi:osmoprotectant transport system substrate-binding protein
MRMFRRTPHRSRWVAFAAMVLLVAACGDDPPPPGNDGVARGTVVIGSTDFSEQEIVASMYALVLEQAGYTAERRFGLGSREVVLPALEQGDIDLYPEYVGTALEFLTGGAGEATTDTAETTRRLREEFAQRGVAVLEPTPAEDKNGLVVTQETADRHELETVSDLEPVAGELVFGGPPECPQRPLCLPGYEAVYGLQFATFRALDASGPVTWAALEGGDIDVALMFTTQGIISERGWVLLEEDRELQPAENIVPVIREAVLTDEIERLLDEVSAGLTTEAVTELNKRVDVDGEEPEAVAEDWLREEGLIA